MKGIPQKMSQLKDKEELEDGINRKDDTIVIFKNILVISYKIYGVRLTKTKGKRRILSNHESDSEVDMGEGCRHRSATSRQL